MAVDKNLENALRKLSQGFLICLREGHNPESKEFQGHKVSDDVKNLYYFLAAFISLSHHLTIYA